MINFAVENLATIVESITAVYAATLLAEPRYKGKKQFLPIAVVSLLLTLLISFLNGIQAFSFFTIATTFCYVIISLKFTSKGSLLLRATSCVLVYLVIHTLDYIVFFSMGLLIEDPIPGLYTFSVLMTPGPQRWLYLLIDKSADVLLCVCLRPFSGKLKIISRRYLWIVFSISAASYCVMSALISMILQEKPLVTQIAVILVWVFSVLSVFAATGIVLLVAKNQQGERTNDLLKTTNSLMAENYSQIHENQIKLAKNIHDFHHHLSVLRGFSVEHDNTAIQEYIDTLLGSSYQEIALCHSGNDVIDAIINAKAAQAKTENIKFHYRVKVKNPLQINSTDICAVLSNQVDNAIEASRLLEIENREINVHIWQENEQVVFFKVVNRVACNPFDGNEQLASTKQDIERPHGLGIQSIQDTVTQYSGGLKNEYKDGYFISLVFLCCGEHSTK